ncbi:MAG: hypothetical protein AMXMBFR47_01880 [Planctomycetota bacterium]
MAKAGGGPWYADGLQFTCTQCGNCCGGAPGYVWVHPLEIDEIAKFVGLTPVDFIEKHTRSEHGRRSLLELENGDCEFLERTEDGKSRCSIHPVRPVQCRTWPFWESNLRSEKAWAATARGCPGMNTGEHHPLPVIQAALARNEERRLPL